MECIKCQCEGQHECDHCALSPIGDFHRREIEYLKVRVEEWKQHTMNAFRLNQHLSDRLDELEQEHLKLDKIVASLLK